MPRVVVVGFDALDPRIVSRLMAAGKLPHFERLATTGALASVATTQPAETPVAFATFSTATNPGGHGIFDFVRRDPATYLLDQALNRYEQKSRFLPPKVVNLRRGVPVWQLLSEAGLPSVVLRPPCSYAPDNILGRMLSGMGVPDLRGGLGTPTFYTTNADTRPEHDENLVHLEASAGQAIRTYILGPRNPTNRQPCRVDLEVRAEADGSMICEHCDGEPFDPRLAARSLEPVAAIEVQSRIPANRAGDGSTLPSPHVAAPGVLCVAGQFRPRVAAVPHLLAARICQGPGQAAWGRSIRREWSRRPPA